MVSLPYVPRLKALGHFWVIQPKNSIADCWVGPYPKRLPQGPFECIRKPCSSDCDAFNSLDKELQGMVSRKRESKSDTLGTFCSITHQFVSSTRSHPIHLARLFVSGRPQSKQVQRKDAVVGRHERRLLTGESAVRGEAMDIVVVRVKRGSPSKRQSPFPKVLTVTEWVGAEIFTSKITIVETI